MLDLDEIVSRPLRQALIVRHKSSQARKAVLGKDAEIQAMEGNVPVLQMSDFTAVRRFLKFHCQPIKT
jgi:hypothetical protein